MQEELLETLRAGPGEAARREVAVTKTGPAPSRWTLRTIRASVDWLTDYTVSGVGRVLQACGLGLHPSWARLFSPDPDYRSKVRRLYRCLRDGRGTPTPWWPCSWTSLVISAGRTLPPLGESSPQWRHGRGTLSNGGRSGRSMP